MIHKFLPRAYRNKVEELINFSGSKRSAGAFIDRTFIISIGISLIAGAIFLSNFLLAFGIAFAVSMAMLHGMLILSVDKRSKFVEGILPDALQLMSANMKSGFIPSRAMILSARKEFGPLSEAIKRSGKEMMTGRSLQESLRGVTKTIRSEVLETTVSLVVKGIKAGGQLVALFEETSLDIRRRESIKKEVKANILMYGIFIGFAGCAGAPLLYALSTYLVTTISKLGAVAQVPNEFQSRIPMMSFGEMSVDEGFLFMFSLAAIIITTVFGGMIIGIIDSGSEKAGIKYIPLMLGCALAVFFIGGMVVNMMFGTLIPG
jgi:archaellum biogenesis protein FlaJ (TadC family)